jgi:hypothetical protein
VREIPFPTPAYTDDPFASFVESVFGLFFVPGSDNQRNMIGNWWNIYMYIYIHIYICIPVPVVKT